MKRHMGLFLLALLVLAVLVVSTVAFTVDELEDVALVKTFGKVTAVYRGSQDAGLRFKWPWPIQRLVRYDSRIHTLETPHKEVTTDDSQNIQVTVYCNWRIDDAERFHKALETIKEANERIKGRLSSQSASVIGEHRLEEFVNTDPAKMKLPQIEQEIFVPLKAELARDYGVELRSIGIKTIGLPEDVSEYVINAQKKEQEKKVQRYKAAGEAEATAIRARAERASKQILAFTAAKALKIKAEGDSAAAKHYQRFAKNEKLAVFIRSLESLEKELASRTVILLDGSQLPAIRYFTEGPSLQPAGPPAIGGTSETPKSE